MNHFVRKKVVTLHYIELSAAGHSFLPSSHSSSLSYKTSLPFLIFPLLLPSQSSPIFAMHTKVAMK